MCQAWVLIYVAVVQRAGPRVSLSPAARLTLGPEQNQVASPGLILLRD